MNKIQQAIATILSTSLSDSQKHQALLLEGKMKAKKLLTTAIEWVLNSDRTPGYAINLWVGCTKISPACDECYAEISRVSKCLGVKWGDDAPRYKCNPYKRLTAINNKAAKQCIRIRVFINPDSDIFDNKVPQQWRDEFFNFVWSTPSIDYILVTKRIGNAKRMIPQHWLDNGYPANVWQLITVCNQGEVDRDIPKLLELDVSVRGLSIEPLLGEIDLWNVDIDWAIVGGESGSKARPMNPSWVHKIRNQCVAENVPFFFKQWGEWITADNQSKPYGLGNSKTECRIIDNTGTVPIAAFKIGTKRAGHLLDGDEWRQMPEVK
jgi:protein gp37